MGGTEYRQMSSTEAAAFPTELAVAHGTKDPRSAKRRGVLRAAAGFLLPFLAGFPFVVSGAIRVSWGEWLFALSAVLAVWSLLWCVLLLGWDNWLRFDPHFLLVPSAASATLLWLFVYMFPDIRFAVLQGWLVVLLFGAGLTSLREVLALNTFMVGGYLGTIALLAARGEPISWRFEIALLLVPFVLFAIFCGTVLERLRREKAEMKALRHQLSHLALTDQLTDLPNRRQFEEHLQRQSALCSRTGATYAVGVIDVDHFKEINDGSGHEVGDRVLVDLARIISSHLRQSDLAARLGGDEFAVLLAETNATEAGAVLNRVLQSAASYDFSVGGLRSQVTVSIGVAERQGEKTADDVLRQADTVLYEAKRQGRNRVVVSATERPSRVQAGEELSPR